MWASLRATKQAQQFQRIGHPLELCGSTAKTISFAQGRGRSAGCKTQADSRIKAQRQGVAQSTPQGRRRAGPPPVLCAERAQPPPPRAHLLCSAQRALCFSTSDWCASSGAEACSARHRRSARRCAASAAASSHRMRALQGGGYSSQQPASDWNSPVPMPHSIRALYTYAESTKRQCAEHQTPTPCCW
jgi:hypothetical protein